MTDSTELVVGTAPEGARAPNRRGRHPASRANLQPTCRAVSGAWSVERGKPLPIWLPWAEGVERLLTDYLDALITETEPGCHLCAALAVSTARARGGLACVESAGKTLGVDFASKSGVRKLWRDAAFWEDRWLAPLERLHAHRQEHERSRKTPDAMAYLKSIEPAGDAA